MKKIEMMNAYVAMGVEQTETLPGGGFHGGEQTETLPGGGFHGSGQAEHNYKKRSTWIKFSDYSPPQME